MYVLSVINDYDQIENNLQDDFIILDCDFSYEKCNMPLKDIKHKTEFETIFNYQKYLDDILKTYDYKLDNIHKQFKKDFDRCKLAINNVPFKDINLFIEEANETMGAIAIMLLNQSTFGCPMEKIIKYHTIQDNYFLTDFRGSYIFINICDESEIKKKIHLHKRLKIIELVNDKNGIFIKKQDKFYVDIYLIFTFSNINQYIRLTNINKYVDKFNTMIWKVTPV